MDIEVNRLSRLTAILVKLLAKQLVKAPLLAAKYGVSVRTIYRDIRTLEQAGVPILTIEGKGYRLMNDYRLPPVMLTEDEANAIITAELLIRSSKDLSLIENFGVVVAKLRSVMPPVLQIRADELQAKVGVANIYIDRSVKSSVLLHLQKAMLDQTTVEIEYTDKNNNSTVRNVEPFALYANQNNDWVMVAMCQLRNDFREFSLPNIKKLNVLSNRFKPQNISFKRYLEQKHGRQTRNDLRL